MRIVAQKPNEDSQRESWRAGLGGVYSGKASWDPAWLQLHPGWGFPGGASDEEPACQRRRHIEARVRFLGQEDPLEEDMATQSSILAWGIP